MKFNKLLYLLLLICLNLNGQEKETISTEKKDSYVTGSIFPTIDPFAPRFRVGYVQHLAPNWKLGLEIGYGYEGLSQFFSYQTNTGREYRLWEVRPEIHYILNPKHRTLQYFSLELFYISQNHVFENGNYTLENNEILYFDRADFSRRKYGLHLKYGVFVNTGKHFGFNFYGGLGFRIANKQYSNVLNPTTNSDLFQESPIVAPYQREGVRIGFTPTLGVKLYYKI